MLHYAPRMCPFTSTAALITWGSTHHIQMHEVIEVIQNPLTVTTYHQNFAKKCMDVFSRYFQVFLNEMYKRNMKQRANMSCCHLTYL